MLTEEKSTPENMVLFPSAYVHQREDEGKRNRQEEGILCICRNLLLVGLGDRHMTLIFLAFLINIYYF